MLKNLSSTVYFDNAATTRTLDIALQTYLEVSQNYFGNSSSQHLIGKMAHDLLDQYQEKIANYFDVPPSHIVFTSGGTESNNLGIWSALGGIHQAMQWIQQNSAAQKPNAKILTTAIEHPASEKVFESLECMGAPVGWIGVQKDGRIDFDHLHDEIKDQRIKAASLHHVQNEVGIMQDIQKFTQIIREGSPEAYIHLDAIQSFLKVPLKEMSFEKLGVDMLSISAHKFGGPKGIGALILSRRFENRTQKICPFLQGSSQQEGLRPGTVPVPLIAAMTKAIEYGVKNLTENHKKILELRDYFIRNLPAKYILNGPEHIAGDFSTRAPQTVNFSSPGTASSTLVDQMSAQGFCISAGSACNSTNPKPNATLMQMKAGRERALSAIRVSFSSQNTLSEVDAFFKALNQINE